MLARSQPLAFEKLTFTNKEFKEYEKDLMQTIDDINLNIKCLKSVSQTGMKITYEVKTQIKDRLICLPARIDTLECIDYADINRTRNINSSKSKYQSTIKLI